MINFAFAILILAGVLHDAFGHPSTPPIVSAVDPRWRGGGGRHQGWRSDPRHRRQCDRAVRGHCHNAAMGNVGAADGPGVSRVAVSPKRSLITGPEDRRNASDRIRRRDSPWPQLGIARGGQQVVEQVDDRGQGARYYGVVEYTGASLPVDCPHACARSCLASVALAISAGRSRPARSPGSRPRWASCRSLCSWRSFSINLGFINLHPHPHAGRRPSSPLRGRSRAGVSRSEPKVQEWAFMTGFAAHHDV
jgi:hypothetical protein